MFYGYPIAATAQNWLHECLVEMVTAIHGSLDARRRPPAWPAIIPTAHRTSLRKRFGLRNYLANYTTAARRLTPTQRTQVLTCLNQQNAIADLVGCASTCECLTDLPEPNRLLQFTRDLVTQAVPQPVSTA